MTGQPRNVRPFWISAEIDGRTTKLEGGPAAKDGGFDLIIYQRADGRVVKAASITGRAHPNGQVILRIWPGVNGDGKDAGGLQVSYMSGGEIVLNSGY